jgi:hypothetical protein
MVWLLASIALGNPVALARGDDLTAIRAIEGSQLAPDDAVEAWRAFLLAFTDSPLASQAYRALVQLDGLDGDWVPGDKRIGLARVARQVALEDAEVARPLLQTVPAPLNPDGTPVIDPRPTWSSRAEASVGWDGLPLAAAGVGLHRGPATLTLRIGKQRAWYAEFGARLLGPLSFGPWVEVHVDTLRRPGVTMGGEVAIARHLALEARAGFITDRGMWMPRLATALVVRLPAPRLLVHGTGS